MAANPPKSVKLRISDALSDLSVQEFKKFGNYLREREGEPRIRLNDVEKKDHLDIAELLVKFFTDDGALRVAVDTLKQAGFNKQAKELAAGWESSAPPPSNPPSASSGSSGTSGKHFVDEHRLDLIKRVSNIDPILDELLDRDVIQQETYDSILKLPTTQEKVRKLYSGPLKAGKAPKDIFYESLMNNEQYLIDDLKKNK